MTFIVLAIDALDAALIERFGVTELELESAGRIDTFAHSKSAPYTPEVWATVATGLSADEHGVTGSGTSEWENPLLEFASRFTGRLSEGTRGTLGRLVRETTGERENLGSTDRETMFSRDDRVVRNWPGLTDGTDLQYAWDLMNAVAEDASKQEFERKLFGLCAEQFGWAREMLNHDVALAGVHVHALDGAGHAYADDEASLAHAYRCVGDFVAELVESLGDGDELLVLSDHGMRVEFLDEDAGKDSGSHSWRAYASTTVDADVPESVFDVREWTEARLESTRGDEDAIEMPVEQLRELGYID